MDEVDSLMALVILSLISLYFEAGTAPLEVVLDEGMLVVHPGGEDKEGSPRLVTHSKVRSQRYIIQLEGIRKH